jgi:hypothetical protein
MRFSNACRGVSTGCTRRSAGRRFRPKNRGRLLEEEIATAFLAEVLVEAEAAGLVSDEHSTIVDGTLLEACAS